MFSDFGPELNCFYARQCAASGLPRPSKRTKMLYIPLQYLLALTSKGCMFYRLHPLLLVFVGVRSTNRRKSVLRVEVVTRLQRRELILRMGTSRLYDQTLCARKQSAVVFLRYPPPPRAHYVRTAWSMRRIATGWRPGKQPRPLRGRSWRWLDCAPS